MAQQRMLMKGSEAIAEAAIRAGCRHFFGYPITPQNEIPEYMSARLPQVDGTFVQAESEVAASGSPRRTEISCSWWRPATWTSSPAMRARRCISGARGSTTITLCAGRAGTPSRSPVQPRNDGQMP